MPTSNTSKGASKAVLQNLARWHNRPALGLVVILVAAAVLAVASKAQTLVLTSDPPGATLLLRGGVEVGQTPVSLLLLSGMPMEITSRWGSLETVTVTVVPGKGQTVVHRFEHLYGTLIVESDRDDAVLKIDGGKHGD